MANTEEGYRVPTLYGTGGKHRLNRRVAQVRLYMSTAAERGKKRPKLSLETAHPLGTARMLGQGLLTPRSVGWQPAR